MDYPEESLCSVAPLRFLCDEMLRGVADWLRIAGYDTLTPSEGLADDAVLATAIADDRWLITRDSGLYERQGAVNYVILLKSQNLQDNLRELATRLDIDWLHRPFSRCKRCNTVLQTGISPTTSDPVPADIANSKTTLRYCLNCEHFFWEGSHVKRMRSRLRSLNRDQLNPKKNT